MSGLWIASNKPRQQGSVMDGLAVAVLLFATVSLFASPSGAQELAPGSGKVDARGSVYSDDDETTIITSYVGTELGLPGRVRFGAHGLVDIISTASVDVVAAATPSFEEVRVEFGARAGMVVSDGVDLGLAFVRSAENDWTSYIPQLTSSSANPTTTTRARLPTQTIRSAPCCCSSRSTAVAEATFTTGRRSTARGTCSYRPMTPATRSLRRGSAAP